MSSLFCRSYAALTHISPVRGEPEAFMAHPRKGPVDLEEEALHALTNSVIYGGYETHHEDT
jgi:hypothetical protein